MKKLGKVMLIGISALVVGIILFANAPVQVHRLFGGYNKADRNFYPQWINNEEYCYLRVESYYVPISIWPSPLQMIDPRGDNATFYIYKVNINQSDKKELLRKLDAKVSFYIGQLEILKPNINGDKFTFRRLDNGELVLIIRGRKKYIAYYLNTDGRILKKKVFNANSEFLDWRDIVDISPDGEKLLLDNRGKLYIKSMNTREEDLSCEDMLSNADRLKWVSRNILISYNRNYYEENGSFYLKDYEVYLVFCEKETKYLVFIGKTDDREIGNLFLDASLNIDKNLLFLSKIGIFQKQDESWQMIKSLENMNFSFFYPAWSLDGKYLIGIADGDNLKLIKYEDLLKD